MNRDSMGKTLKEENESPVWKSGTEPATFQLLAQCLNQLRHQQRVSNIKVGQNI